MFAEPRPVRRDRRGRGAAVPRSSSSSASSASTRSRSAARPSSSAPAQRSSREPNRVFWVTAQGRFTDVRERPLGAAVGRRPPRGAARRAASCCRWRSSTRSGPSARPKRWCGSASRCAIADHPGLSRQGVDRADRRRADAEPRRAERRGDDAATRRSSPSCSAGKAGVGGVYDCVAAAQGVGPRREVRPVARAATRGKPAVIVLAWVVASAAPRSPPCSTCGTRSSSASHRTRRSVSDRVAPVARSDSPDLRPHPRPERGASASRRASSRCSRRGTSSSK